MPRITRIVAVGFTRTISLKEEIIDKRYFDYIKKESKEEKRSL